MAYTHDKDERQLADKEGLDTAEVIGDELAIGNVPWIVRAVAVVITTSPDEDGQITVKRRDVAGSSSDEDDIAVINYAASVSAGDVIYDNNLDIEVTPGQSIVAEVTDATPTSGNASVLVYGEMRWENPGNFTNMSETT